MIYFLDGTLAQTKEETLIVNCAGIGYQVFVPSNLIHDLPEVGDPLFVYIYHHIREDAQTLFGFLTEEDRDLFILLTSVSGVGPKVGIKMLSQLSVSELVKAIIQENLVALTSVSGVGKKMAERLVVELKDKLPKLYNTKTLTEEVPSIESKPTVNAEDDLFQAMKTLGYTQDEIKRCYMKAAMEIKPDMPLETSLKLLLKYL